nr:uncharacterized protein SORT1 isoform X3 [Pan troglodytes]
MGRRGPAARIQGAPRSARGCGARRRGWAGAPGGRCRRRRHSAAMERPWGAADGLSRWPHGLGLLLLLLQLLPPATLSQDRLDAPPPPPAAPLVWPHRGELGAAGGRSRGRVSPRRPLASQRAGRGRGVRPGPGLRRQAGQQHAPACGLMISEAQYPCPGLEIALGCVEGLWCPWAHGCSSVGPCPCHKGGHSSLDYLPCTTGNYDFWTVQAISK